ncbi:hypothetical protein Vretifemale_14461, partial [Volvox reticuliferus]
MFVATFGDATLTAAAAAAAAEVGAAAASVLTGKPPVADWRTGDGGCDGVLRPVSLLAARSCGGAQGVLALVPLPAPSTGVGAVVVDVRPATHMAAAARALTPLPYEASGAGAPDETTRPNFSQLP